MSNPFFIAPTLFLSLTTPSPDDTFGNGVLYKMTAQPTHRYERILLGKFLTLMPQTKITPTWRPGPSRDPAESIAYRSSLPS
jgi:hypothetical protein